MEGWIKLHRKIIENPIFMNPELLQLFIYCLLRANHEPKQIIFNGKYITVEDGQFITGREVLGSDLKQNPNTIYKRLKKLENLDFLNIKSNNRFSLVTIANYKLYQTKEEKSNSTLNNKVTTKEQQSNTNKNEKNYKNEKNIYSTVVDYLNNKTNSNYKSNSGKTKTLIDARLNEGFTEQDFFKVIDNKSQDWLQDSKMCQYLRPETLFSNKFEGYLNQKVKKIASIYPDADLEKYNAPVYEEFPKGLDF